MRLFDFQTTMRSTVVFLILAFAGFEKKLKEGNNKIVDNVAKIFINAFLLFIFFNLNLSH